MTGQLGVVGANVVAVTSTASCSSSNSPATALTVIAGASGAGTLHGGAVLIGADDLPRARREQLSRLVSG